MGRGEGICQQTESPEGVAKEEYVGVEGTVKFKEFITGAKHLSVIETGADVWCYELAYVI